VHAQPRVHARSTLPLCHRTNFSSKIRAACDRATIDGENDITRNDAGLGCRATGWDFGHQSPFDLLQAKSVGNIRGDGLDFLRRAPHA
jgi:hypothetical protein